MLGNACLKNLSMMDLLLLIMPTIKYTCLCLEMHVPFLTLHILYFPLFATVFYVLFFFQIL